MLLPSHYAKDPQKRKHSGRIDRLFEEYFSGPLGRSDIIILDNLISPIDDSWEVKEEESLHRSNSSLSQTINDIRLHNEE